MVYQVALSRIAPPPFKPELIHRINPGSARPSPREGAFSTIPGSGAPLCCELQPPKYPPSACVTPPETYSNPTQPAGLRPFAAETVHWTVSKTPLTAQNSILPQIPHISHLSQPIPSLSTGNPQGLTPSGFPKTVTFFLPDSALRAQS